MALPIPHDQRLYSGQYLSDLLGGKIVVECSKCSLRKQFDAAALLDRIEEDCPLPDLIRQLRLKLKCETALAYSSFTDPQCRMVYDVATMLTANAHLPDYRDTKQSLLAYLRRQ